MQKTTSAEETVEAKRRFEVCAENCGVKVLHHHADNGIFADDKFRKQQIGQRTLLAKEGVERIFEDYSKCASGKKR